MTQASRSNVFDFLENIYFDSFASLFGCSVAPVHFEVHGVAVCRPSVARHQLKDHAVSKFFNQVRARSRRASAFPARKTILIFCRPD
jgi:hypothetical protein